MVCLHSYSVGIHSVVVPLICITCTITVGISPLSFRFIFAVYLWCIFTGIASAFIYASFSTNMRSSMPCFPGISLARIIAIYIRKLDRCSNLFCLSPRSLNTFCIMIVLQLPTEKNPPIQITKSTVEKLPVWA